MSDHFTTLGSKGLNWQNKIECINGLMAVKNDDLAMVILLLYSNCLKPLMKNVLKLLDHGQTHFKNIAVNAERFLKCVYFTTLCFIGLIVQSFQGRIFAIKIFHKLYV